MIRLEVLAGNHTHRDDLSMDDISTLISDPATLIWIDLQDPTPPDFELLAQEFAFHPLALDDARARHQRPKIEQYDGFLFLIFYTVALVPNERIFEPREISLFVGANYLVTVHDGEIPEIEATARRWNENVARLKSQGVAVLLYSLLDTIVDSYFPVLDDVADQAETLEEAIFNGDQMFPLQRIFLLRKCLLTLRRVIGPERDLLNMLTRRDIELLGPDTAVYFQDVHDHVLRVTDSIDTYRDLLASALEAHLSVVSNTLNQVMRTMTAWSIILMTLALIAGIYGMNFVLTPSSRWPGSFPLVVVSMGALGAALLVYFRLRHWL